MPLSRHFYSLDEVHAAIQYTSTRGPPTEALFWTQEMLYSGAVAEAISALFQAWLWNTGPMSLTWLLNASKTLAADELSENDILLAANQLASIHHSLRDSSIWNILVLTEANKAEVPDTITRKAPPGAEQYTDEKELYFVCALFQGKARCAWWISQYIPVNRVWEMLSWYITNSMSKFKSEYESCIEALKNYEQLLGYQSDEYDAIVRCCAIIACSMPVKLQLQSFKPLDSEIGVEGREMLEEFSRQLGRRAARKYKVPQMALYGTLRGRSKWSQKNLTQLYNIERYLCGCPFWDEALAEYATIYEDTIQWLSDEKKEEFYEKYFPDDIPDEWSKADHLKSHGDGILGPTDKPNIQKYSRCYMSKMPRFAWNSMTAVNKYLEGLNISDCSLEKIITLGEERVLADGAAERLKPVHKIKTI
jgi:hypothetical protein